MADKRQRTSFVWEHFTVDEKLSDKVRCNDCKLLLSFNNSTSSMIKHLQLKHPYRVSSSSYSEAEPKPKFARMDAFLEGSSRTCNDSRADKLNNLICLMIVKDLRPLSTVEGDGFKSLISFSEPGYNIPGRTFFASKLRNMYANLKDSLKTSLCLRSVLSCNNGHLDQSD